jgi:hypothetical protein
MVANRPKAEANDTARRNEEQGEEEEEEKERIETEINIETQG